MLHKVALVATLLLFSECWVFYPCFLFQDKANKNGGKWIVRLKKGLASRCWENLVSLSTYWYLKTKIKDEKSCPQYRMYDLEVVARTLCMSFQNCEISNCCMFLDDNFVIHGVEFCVSFSTRLLFLKKTANSPKYHYTY